ncbi:tyrosinase cofactor [Streptomyces sp. NPDC001914]|uniref:apotyrosinase chaperone MelC1 n=1 Tax=Streptomyces sp. NPDC001914 TaxID=3364623 RepID=UPI0036A40133
MPELTRRRALGAAAALAVGAGAQALAAPAASAASASPNGPAPSQGSMAGHHHGGPEAFDEVFRGRRIEGRPVTGGGHHHGAGYAVFIDGAELHVMSNADGSWISVVSHYDPVPTPRDAARAAVVELQGAPLVPFAAN